ncbi:MAG: hypothetical protein R8G34_20675 [Paracoccaceae bacterium]|nr:hypothetical protein [Paracoccaceae bacterium]
MNPPDLFGMELFRPTNRIYRTSEAYVTRGRLWLSSRDKIKLRTPISGLRKFFEHLVIVGPASFGITLENASRNSHGRIRFNVSQCADVSGSTATVGPDHAD